MQNKHIFFYFGVPTRGEGGVNPVGTNYQVFPQITSDGNPDDANLMSSTVLMVR